MTTVVVVSDDVMVEILAKLPVKSLLRFHCVCKTWYSVISDPQFSNNLHRRQPSVLICDCLSEFSTITIESLVTTKDRTLTPTSPPWETKPNDCYSKTRCLGSCNGLVCVSHRSRRSSHFIIWNPSTRKFRRLPRPRGYSVSIEDSFWTYFWFGYDEPIDDYKLVRLHLENPPKVAELDVFTLKSNTWRRSSVDHIAVVSYTWGRATGVLSNGAIHWITRDSFSNEKCILVLDLATEKLRVLKFRHAPLDNDSQIVSLEGGCLCLCTHAYQDGFRRLERDLWIVKEYGVDSSWTKLLWIRSKFNDPARRYVICPILVSKKGKQMVVICTESMSHNEGRILKFRVEEGRKAVKIEETLLHNLRNPSRTNVILYMAESLVSISPSSSCRKRKMLNPIRACWNFFFSVWRRNNHSLK